MNSIRSTALLTACGLCWIAVAAAQTPAPTNGSTASPGTTEAPAPTTGAATSPEAASSPHQHEVTGETGEARGNAPAPTTGAATDPAAASSPHQHEVTGETGEATGKAMRKDTSAKGFVSKAAQAGMAEVKLAELASEKSQNEAIKKFASHMQSDHSAANSELESVAKQENIPVPDKLDAKHQAEVDSLSKKSGAAFDKAYASAMVKSHKQAVALFKSGSHSSDQNIASFANKTLPTLESHQRMADDLASQLRVASADSGASKR